MRPGDEVKGMMFPRNGGGPMKIFITVDGEELVWNERVGHYDDHERYGVRIRISPIGNVIVDYCKHPCADSLRPWYEPWLTELRQIMR